MTIIPLTKPLDRADDRTPIDPDDSLTCDGCGEQSLAVNVAMVRECGSCEGVFFDGFYADEIAELLDTTPTDPDLTAVLIAALVDVDALDDLTADRLGQILTAIPWSPGGPLREFRDAVQANWDMLREPTAAELAEIAIEGHVRGWAA